MSSTSRRKCRGCSEPMEKILKFRAISNWLLMNTLNHQRLRVKLTAWVATWFTTRSRTFQREFCKLLPTETIEQ